MRLAALLRFSLLVFLLKAILLLLGLKTKRVLRLNPDIDIHRCSAMPIPLPSSSGRPLFSRAALLQASGVPLPMPLAWRASRLKEAKCPKSTNMCFHLSSPPPQPALPIQLPHAAWPLANPSCHTICSARVTLSVETQLISRDSTKSAETPLYPPPLPPLPAERYAKVPFVQPIIGRAALVRLGGSLGDRLHVCENQVRF